MVTRLQTLAVTLALLVFWGIVALGVYALLIPRPARGDDPDSDRERRVRVALALSASQAPAVPQPVAVAPPPHPPAPRVPKEMPGKKLPYSDAYDLAIKERKPLVVFVGFEGSEVPPGSVGTTLPDFAGVERGKAAVTVPHRGGLILDAVVRPELEPLRKAVREAAGKVELPPTAPSAPPPLDWQIRVAPVAVPPAYQSPACLPGRA